MTILAQGSSTTTMSFHISSKFTTLTTKAKYQHFTNQVEFDTCNAEHGKKKCSGAKSRRCSNHWFWCSSPLACLYAPVCLILNFRLHLQQVWCDSNVTLFNCTQHTSILALPLLIYISLTLSTIMAYVLMSQSSLSMILATMVTNHTGKFLLRVAFLNAGAQLICTH